MDREQLLARTFVELADTLVQDFDVVEFLHVVTTRAVQVLGAAAAGVMLADPQGHLRVVASSDERMRLLELFELEAAHGPCLDAYRERRMLQAGPAEATRLWPAFAGTALAAGFTLMCAVPLGLRDDPVGALNLFWSADDQLSDPALQTAQALADIATISLLQTRALRESRLLAEQLQHALSSRILIEQAKGFIAERSGASVDQAFDAIRSYTRAHNRRLTDTARDIIEGLTAND